MKYLKYGIGLIGACAIVSASVVAPFSYAFDEVDVYNDITEYFDTITGLGLISVLDNFYTYGYIGLQSSDGKITRLSLCISKISTRTNGFNKYVEFTYKYPSSINGVLTGGNSIELVNDTLSNYEYIEYGGLRYTFSTSGNQIIYFDMPDYYYPNSSSDTKSTPVSTSFSKKLSNPPVGNFSSNINYVIDKYKPPTPTLPPNTTPAPGFPNLPDNWVNGGGDINIDIDIPDIDFSIDLPEYTLPEKPEIPNDVGGLVKKIFSTCNDLLVESGLIWVVGLSLFLSLLLFILK